MATNPGRNVAWVFGLMALLLSAGVRAEKPPCAKGTQYPCDELCRDCHSIVYEDREEDVTGGFAHPETPIVPAPAGTPQTWDQTVSRLPTPGIIPQRLMEHRDFIQPFLTPAVFPEISARIMTSGGYGSRSRNAEFDQFLYLSGYVIDVYAPLFTVRDSTPFLTNNFRVDLKAPFLFGHNAVTLFLGANLPVEGPWTDAGYNMMLGYAFGARIISFQFRTGFGLDQLIGEYAGPRATSFIGDVAVGGYMTPWLRLLLQADGRKLLGQEGGTLRIFPGIRLYPYSEATLSFGVGAQVWMDSFTGSGAVTNFTVRRAGAFFDVGYVFF